MSVHCLLEGALSCSSARSAAWQGEWLLVGTDSGSLKTLKISPVSPLPGLATTANTESIQSEDGEAWHTPGRSGHPGPVRCVSADVVCRLLATGDSAGNIMIWEEAEGQWQQLSSFNFGVSGALAGLQWVPCKAFLSEVLLCLLHDDGHLLCVTLEGQRVWARDVKKSCSCFCVSPNGSGFVLASHDGEVAFYDSRGIYLRKLSSKVEPYGQDGITVLAWQPGSWAVRPILAAYATGSGMLLHPDGDCQPLSFKTGLSSCVAAAWNTSGMVAALLGLPAFAASPAAAHFPGKHEGVLTGAQGQNPDAGALVVLVQACGKLIATINLASEEPRALAWATGGERLAAATNTGVFILSFRYHAVCCSYGEDAVAAAAPLSRKQLATEVSFLSDTGGYRTVRRFRGPRFLACGESLCAVVPQATSALPPSFSWRGDRFGFLLQSQCQEGPHRLPDENSSHESPNAVKRQQEMEQEGFPVELCDTSGNTVETVMSPLGPAHAILLPHLLVIADNSHHLWFHHLSREKKSTAVPMSALIDLSCFCESTSRDTCNGNTCALDGHGKCLIVARTTGQLLRLRLLLTTPQIQLEASGIVPTEFCSVKLNRQATALAGMDVQGWLHVVAVAAPRQQIGHSSCFGAKLCDAVEGVLDYVWASDHDDLIAVLRQMGLVLVYAGCQNRTPSFFVGANASKGPPLGPLYLIEFCNLRARALCFPALMQQRIDGPKQEILKHFDAEPLLQMRNLLGSRRKHSEDSEGPAGLQQAAAFAARFNHPILWRLLAEAALASEELGITEEALVRCEDYCSLQLLRQARLLNPRGEGRPFIAALSGDILGAGAFFEAQQKLSHAAHLFASFGLWDVASDALKLAVSSSRRGEQNCLRKVKVALADAWKEQGSWIKAIDLYTSLKPQEGLLEAYFLSGRYEELECLANKLPEVGTKLTLRAAQLLAAAGRGATSADAFLKAGRPELAVDAALYSGEWAQAVSLARQHCDSTKLQAVTCIYRNAMQHQHKKCIGGDIVEAFLTIGAFEAAAHELASLPKQLGHALRNPQRQRKMHVTAALLSRKHHFRVRLINENRSGTPCLCCSCTTTSDMHALPGVACSFPANSLSREEARHWKSAAASHLYLLCCFHLSEQRARAALCTAMRLWECYQQEISLYVSAQLLFISAYKSKEWDLCSQALHALQMDVRVSPGCKHRLEATCLVVFSRRQMLEAAWACQLPCANCSALSSYWECFCPSCDFSFPWCAATGLPVRYVRWILHQTSANEGGESRHIASPVPAASSTSSPGDRENVWPYGGPSVPEACGVCGLFTVAWGPEGPIRSCPLCSQPFSCTPEEGKHPEIPAKSFAAEDVGWRWIINGNPEDILFQADCLGELASG